MTINDSQALEKLSNRFKMFADMECEGVSRLYYQLSYDISQERELLKLALHCRKSQPVPNLLFGAVHYLLLKYPDEELANYYPSISETGSGNIPIDKFKTFCNRRRPEIIDLLEQRIVQTNAINRTSYLMPILSSLYQSSTGINIIDIGTSSGLTMNLDLYEYDYEEGQVFGSSPVKIKTKILEGKLPGFDQMVKIKKKIGIDQNPLDLKEEDKARWLRALIWPDQKARFERLTAAIRLMQQSDVELRKASNTKDFAQIIGQIPKEEALFVYHTHVLYQFSKEARMEFRAMLDGLGHSRDFHYLAVEGPTIFDGAYEEKEVIIELNSYKDGLKETKWLGTTNGHADWIKWR